jgi:hypothetical protein
VKRAVVIGAAAAVFLALAWNGDQYWDAFYYLFSVQAHRVSELVRFELIGRLFPPGFFSEKLGHVVLLKTLSGVLGPGVDSLYAIEMVYAGLLVGTAGAAYGFLRELEGPTKARTGALLFAFSPLALYLAYKPLSEVPSMLFTILGCWAFIRAFRPLMCRPSLPRARSVSGFMRWLWPCKDTPCCSRLPGDRGASARSLASCGSAWRRSRSSPGSSLGTTRPRCCRWRWLRLAGLRSLRLCWRLGALAWPGPWSLPG